MPFIGGIQKARRSMSILISCSSDASYSSRRSVVGLTNSEGEYNSSVALMLMNRVKKGGLQNQ